MTKSTCVANAAARPTTVAIIEDDARTRQLVKELIDHAHGLECTAQYPFAEVAIEELPAVAPDIVLADVHLPGASGIACVRQLKPKMPGTHFIMLTAYDDSDLIFEALSAGAVGFLLKRAIATELEKAVSDTLLGGSPMSSSVARKVVRAFQRAPAAAPEIERLSERERQVLDLLARGQFYKEIADNLAIAKNTVHTYIRRIYEKLHVQSRMAAVAKLSSASSSLPDGRLEGKDKS